jgi:hypothetical protein
VTYLDAEGQHRMTYWLEELQKKRRRYNAQRKTISAEKMAFTLKVGELKLRSLHLVYAW